MRKTLRQAQGDNSKDRYKVKSTVTLRFSKCEVGQTLRQAQGDNSKDRYKLTVFLKVIFRKEFSANTLFMHYPENLHRIFGGIPVFLLVLNLNNL
ncbi:MAG: hypothetical protein P9L89_01255 [Candidatus Celaenobacter polaris]|nr:hypothetical protein [Candidatus Celaenobacter polaris]